MSRVRVPSLAPFFFFPDSHKHKVLNYIDRELFLDCAYSKIGYSYSCTEKEIHSCFIYWASTKKKEPVDLQLAPKLHKLSLSPHELSSQETDLQLTENFSPPKTNSKKKALPENFRKGLSKSLITKSTQI